MKASKYKILFFLFFCLPVFSQNFLGISTGNYSGTNALPLNPAHVSDSRNSVYIHLGGVGFDMHNNYARWKAPFSLINMLTGNYDNSYRSPTSGKLVWMPDYASVNQDKRNLRMILNAEARGPAIQVSLPKWKTGIAAGVRYRMLTSLNNTSEPVGEAIVFGLKGPNHTTVPSTDNTFNLNNGLYHEFFLTIGRTLIEEDERFVKWGITAKRLVSNFATNLHGSNVDFMITPYAPNPNRRVIHLTETVADFSNVSAGGISLGGLLSPSGLGSGFGADIGIVYEYRPDARRYEFTHNGRRMSDPTKNKYKYKIGLSLIDIGYIKFQDDIDVLTGDINSVNDQILPNDFYRLQGTSGFIRSVERVFNLNPNTYGHSYRALYPATAVLSFDYAFDEKFYMNTVWRQSLLPSDRRGVIGYSGISFIPRYELKYLEIAAPVSLDNNYSNLTLGLGLRAGGLYFGSDNMLGIFNVKGQRGISAYLGLFIPIAAKLPESSLKCYGEQQPTTGRRRKFNLFRKR